MFKSDVDIKSNTKKMFTDLRLAYNFSFLCLTLFVFVFFFFFDLQQKYLKLLSQMAANKILSCISYFSVCSTHPFTLTHMLLDAFNLEMYNRCSHCSINGSHNFIFHPLMLQELHIITPLAVLDRKKTPFYWDFIRSPMTAHSYPQWKKVQFKDKNKANI